MSLIIYYIFLLLITGVITRNAHLGWKIKKDFTLPICTAIMYYFTIGGAIIFPFDEYTGFKGVEIGMHYLPIFDMLFPVTFNQDYIIACVYYLAFILLFQYTYLFLYKKLVSKNVEPSKSSVQEKTNAAYILNPYFVFFSSLILVSISIYFMRNEILYAITHEESVYLITRASKNRFYTIHQLANEFSVLIPFIAYTLLLVKPTNFNIQTDNKKRTLYIILLSCILSSLYISFIGNRREILSGIILCTLISFNQIEKVNKKRYAGILVVVLTFFLANDFFRSTIIPTKINQTFIIEKQNNIVLKEKEEFFTSDQYTKGEKTKQVLTSFLFSNELFYAHFSMYGAIHKDIPLTYGSSFLHLAASMIPRSIYPNRPDDIYNYYAKKVNAKPGQIYTIHHATSWYLNFGLVGIFIGAVTLGAIFSFASYLNSSIFNSKNPIISILHYLAPFLLCAHLVTFITAGPEAYKSLLFEGILIPIILLRLCFVKTSIK